MSSKYKGNEKRYIGQVLDGKGGDWIARFEAAFAERFRAKFAIAANSGTSALIMALEALPARGEVITTGLSVIMNTSAILFTGNIPVYADINDLTFNINPKRIKKLISSRTVAIMPVSLYGLPSPMEEIRKIALDHNLPVIEDNAEALIRHRADMSIYSFETTKHLSTGEGGMILTNDERYAREARLFGNHGFKQTRATGTAKLDHTVLDPSYCRHSNLGQNYRFTPIQAAIGLAQLERVDEILARRRRMADAFREIIGKEWPFECQEDHPKHAYWTFAVVIENNGWERFRDLFIKNGGKPPRAAWQVPYNEPVISGRSYVERLHESDQERNTYDYENCCPIAEKLQTQIMQFNLGAETDKEADREIEILRRTMKEFLG
jgi:perosamine synthetase